MITSIIKQKQWHRLIYLVHCETLPSFTGLLPPEHTASRQSFAPKRELVLRAGVMAMTETASIEITQPTSRVEWRRIHPIIGFDRCDLVSDPVVHHLGLCLHAARSRPSEMSPVCADHIASALEAYLNQAHNVVSLPPPAARGGLAPWQLRQAKEMLVSRLDEPISLAGLAHACKLSPGHFPRAFRQTTGQPPHRWLMEQRIEKAKQLLVETTLSLAQIAQTCGFADQSHFTRVFAQLVQSSPGHWRRHWRTGPVAA